MAFLDMMNPETGFISPLASRAVGKDLAQSYAAADPFPHIVIDSFLPLGLAGRLLSKFGQVDNDNDLNTRFDRPQERLKITYHPDNLQEWSRSVFYAFNSRPFIEVIENITGIEGLIADPHFSGAGYHEIRNGGHLSVHADFNHHKELNLERRVNVLIYLNPGWQDSFGGQLELWEPAMKRLGRSVVPEFNRCVIFNTTSTSMHGNPQPVNHPEGVARRSIALYYYTATWDGSKRAHTTQFRSRPGSSDKTDWRVGLTELGKDLLPPLVTRNLAKMRGSK